DLERESGAQIGVETVMDRFLRLTHRDWPVRADRTRRFERFLHQLIVLAHFVHHAPCKRLLSCESPRAQYQLLRATFANSAWQVLRSPASRNDPERCFGQRETCAARCKDEVARERELAA